MGIISQIPEVPCPADLINFTKDDCRENLGAGAVTVFQKLAGTTPFTAIGSGAGGLDEAATWTTAYALPTTDDSALRNFVFEALNTNIAGGEPNTQDYPDSTSGKKKLLSYQAETCEIIIEQPSSALEGELTTLSAIQEKSGLRFWLISNSNKVFGNIGGFQITSLTYTKATRGTMTDTDQGTLMIEFRRIPAADDIVQLSQATIDAIKA